MSSSFKRVLALLPIVRALAVAPHVTLTRIGEFGTLLKKDV
jgi:hypothetical protein